MLDITNIPPPRVPVIDERTGLMSREWYRFLLNLFRLTGSGSSDVTLTDLQLAPQSQVDFGDLNDSYSQAQLAANCLSNQQAISDLQILPPNKVYLTEAPSDLRPLQADLLQAEMQSVALQTHVNTLSSQLASIQSQIQALSLAPPHTPHVPRLRYGSFYDMTTQTAAAINTAYGMTFNTVSISNGVTIGSPSSRVYVDTKNVYNIQFSAQLDNTSGGDHLIFIWLRVNGVDVADSAGQVRLKGNNSELIASWNYIYPLNANDYFELMWSVNDTAVQIISSAASAPVPAIPSVILTVTDNISA
jgi:hypothetical protein